MPELFASDFTDTHPPFDTFATRIFSGAKTGIADQLLIGCGVSETLGKNN